ncbi:De-etiolated protein 1 Det1, partial [Gracilaria domingensis]
ERHERRVEAVVNGLPQIDEELLTAQVRMVSPYLDRSLFSYNPERSNVLTARRFAPAKDLGSVKFMSAETGELRFKLATEFSLLDGEAEGERGVTENEDVGLRRRMFLFHPLLPFVMAMEGHRPVNFHVYGHAE